MLYLLQKSIDYSLFFRYSLARESKYLGVVSSPGLFRATGIEVITLFSSANFFSTSSFYSSYAGLRLNGKIKVYMIYSILL
jgi:hypothetical protein